MQIVDNLHKVSNPVFYKKKKLSAEFFTKHAKCQETNCSVQCILLWQVSLYGDYNEIELNKEGI